MAPHYPFPPTLLLLPTLFILFSQFTSSETEKQILLNIKNEWGNPPSLISWNSSGDHCKWPGIKCSGDVGNVYSIFLPKKNLSLPIPSSLCNLHNLSHIDLSFNNIPGTFPSVLYSCSALQFLDISQNLFVGELPHDIDNLSRNLTDLILSANNFTGNIPASISRLPAIKRLHLDYNLFSGLIPVELGNVSTLVSLWLAANPFDISGSIPPEFGNLTSLTFLWMTNNNLVGGIPETFEKLVNLEHLDLAMNSLTGVIPSGIWKLKKLKKLFLYGNNLTGEITEFVGEAEALEEIDLSMNKLTGNIPEAVGQLLNLSILFLYFNQLSGEIPNNIGRLNKLTDIRLFNNKLTGILPPELGRYSKLKNLEVDDNRISGNLPENLCEGKALASLIVFDNELTGNIPEELGSCYTLLNLQIHNNGFSSEFPIGIWSAANLSVLIARQNSLAGSLPDELPWNLTLLDIRNNKFVGKIPTLAGGLRVFYGDDNNFSGNLPANFSDIPLLQVLSLSGNRIVGEIPSSMGTLEFLNQLNLRNNLLSGQIPESIAAMPVLNSLDLSVNSLSGNISPKLGVLKLNFLNLSSNSLAGEIPTSLQNQAYDKSFLSNPLLCTSYSLTKLPICRRRSINRSKISIKVLIIFLFLGSCLFLTILALSTFIYRERRHWRNKMNSSDSSSSSSSSHWDLTSFHPVDICESTLARGLTPENLIGSGGGGLVYRVSLNRKTVAVKKVWNNNSRKLDSKLVKQFDAEVKILGSIRHANIVKLLCSVSSPSSKLLIYEYVENGSLDGWLHRRQREQSHRPPLSWPTRLRIAVGAARGLCYMHHECLPAVIHRDVKSSNILLDLEFGAKIADFGLARILGRGGEPESVSTIAGSFGYMAPECGRLRKVNEKVDVYSFGVVLLELATGREAGDGGDEEEGNLADWGWRRYKDGEGDVKEAVEVLPEFREEAVAMFILGLICTGREAGSRPTMKEVLGVLSSLEKGGEDEKCGGDGEVVGNGRLWKKGRRKKKLVERVEEEEDDDESGAALFGGRRSCSSV